MPRLDLLQHLDAPAARRQLPKLAIAALICVALLDGLGGGEIARYAAAVLAAAGILVGAAWIYLNVRRGR